MRVSLRIRSLFSYSESDYKPVLGYPLSMFPVHHRAFHHPFGSAYNLGPTGDWFTLLIETAIAASIVFMALENVITANLRRPCLITGAFGAGDAYRMLGAVMWPVLDAATVITLAGRLPVVLLAGGAIRLILKQVERLLFRKDPPYEMQ